MENSEKTYDVVPNIITGKDLDYLTDMFNWNYEAYKCMNNFVKSVLDEDVKNVINESIDIFHKNMNRILSILNSGGSNEQ